MTRNVKLVQSRKVAKALMQKVGVDFLGLSLRKRKTKSEQRRLETIREVVRLLNVKEN